ncbi:hypothetical protein N7460_006895 [Penicillium canescens]|uniref:Uncharacterized protein n=1 Tax=Penicillium canescens TaxID=5083 RepID=A0AAD6N8K0_PENCN|nr:hypothetical protein N7460_006895 [Penicillium canescens]KAJ6064804.1 hypothetical protein N7444_000457 [Penicillium canescens]
MVIELLVLAGVIAGGDPTEDVLDPEVANASDDATVGVAVIESIVAHESTWHTGSETVPGVED